MKVVVAREFTLHIDYDEAYMLTKALEQLRPSGLVNAGGLAALDAMHTQLLGLVSLASGATIDAVPFRNITEATS